MKKTACLLASLMMLLGSTAFAQNYTPGTYVGESGGRNGVVKVEAEYSADAIVSAKVIEHSETPGISDAPIAQLPEEYVKYQSLGLDVISGASSGTCAQKSISLPRPMDATPRMDLPFTVLLPLFRSTANGKCSVTSRKRFTSSMLSNCTFFTVIVFFTSFLYLYYYFTMI